MDIDKLNKWADLLLDTGKRNNLINFKDAKMGTVEIVSPDFDTLFSKADVFSSTDTDFPDEREPTNNPTSIFKNSSKSSFVFSIKLIVGNTMAIFLSRSFSLKFVNISFKHSR